MPASQHDRERDVPASQHDRERDVPASQPNNTGKENESDRERDVPALQQNLKNMDRWNNTGKCVRDELQKKESNIDRQTVKKEDNHDHNKVINASNILLN